MAEWTFNYNTRLGGEKVSASNPVSWATPEDVRKMYMPEDYSKDRKKARGQVAQFQTKGKKTLINKGGGKSGGGGGGKFGIINRALGRRSPWSLLNNNKNF